MTGMSGIQPSLQVHGGPSSGWRSGDRCAIVQDAHVHILCFVASFFHDLKEEES